MFKQLANRIHSLSWSVKICRSFDAHRSTSKFLQYPQEFSLATNYSTKRFLSDRRFSEKHEWVLLDDQDKNIGTVGISKYAQEALGDVVYVQLPSTDIEVEKDQDVGAIESVKAANELYTPVGGLITEVNTKLDETPSLINKSCYDEGWIFKIKIKNQQEFDQLMDEEKYEEYLKSAR